jgi:choline dehydrogenase
MRLIGSRILNPEGISTTRRTSATDRRCRLPGHSTREHVMNEHDSTAVDFAQRVRANQQGLTSELKSRYDFVVCGAGSSGSVVAGRLAENPDVTVLLVEAGGDDNVPNVLEAALWPTNLGSERDWGFHGLPNPRLNGRSIQFSMGKVLGGGSAINVMVWARGHKSDWELFAAETGNPSWGYDAVLDTYKRIEDWHGAPDTKYRGTGGPVFVQPAPTPQPLAFAALTGARSIGIDTFESPNGRMMEGPGGAAITDVRYRDGKRESVFRSYAYPFMHLPNLTVLTHAQVQRLTFEAQRVTGVEISHRGTTHRIGANREVVLSLGAIHTPKVLMHSGIGDAAELGRFGIPVRQALAGVGRNFQDHVAFDCVWEYPTTRSAPSMSEATVFWTSAPGSGVPDVFACQAAVPLSTEENAARFGLPEAGWTIRGALTHPKSRGRLRLTGPDPDDPILIDANTFADPEDVKAAAVCVELCREIGNSGPLSEFARREVMPGTLTGRELDGFLRDAATSFWHETGTAKMGRDDMSVVDGSLKVYGIDNLRIADGSVMPRITAGNTMAPCVIIGERAAEFLIAEHGI